MNALFKRKNHFHEDLIRCYYIKCDQAKRKGKMEETLKTADKIIEITNKSKDNVQQSQDYLFVAEVKLIDLNMNCFVTKKFSFSTISYVFRFI